MIPSDVPTKDWDETGFGVSGSFGLINPAQSLLSWKVVRNYNVEEDRFRSEPVVTDFQLALPEPGAAASYVVRDRNGAVVREGTGTTDAFERVLLQDVPPEAVRAELRAGEATLTKDIEWPAVELTPAPEVAGGDASAAADVDAAPGVVP